MSNTTIVQDVLDVFRAAGFEVRVSEFGDKPETIIYGTADNAGILMESVCEHFGISTEVAFSCAQRENKDGGAPLTAPAPLTDELRKLVNAYRDAPLVFKTGERSHTDIAFDAIVQFVANARPTDDHLWDQTIRDRDTYHEWADKLADAIAKHFDAYIGEHSNMNCPWAEALEVIERNEDEKPLHFAALLPGPYYMDPPDGGSVSMLEQFRRMAEDAAQWRAHVAKANSPAACEHCGAHLPLHLLTCPVAVKGMAEGKKKEAPEPLRQLLIDLSNNTYFCGLHLSDETKYAGYLAAAEKAEQGLIELFEQSQAAPAPQQSELSDEDIEEIAVDYYRAMTDSIDDVIGFARAIEFRAKAAPAAPVQTAEQSKIVAAPLGSYSSDDQAFFAFWYGHMQGDVMTGPLADVSHATARFIWDAARKTESAPVGFISRDTLAKLQGNDLAIDEHVMLWHADNPPSRAVIPVYLAAPVQAEQAAAVRAALEEAASKLNETSAWDNLRALAYPSTADKASEVRAAEWISVEDKRKPEVRKPVLLFVRTLTRGEDDDGRPYETEGAEVAMGEYQHNNGAPYFDCYSSPMSDNDWVTHWMNLPAAPSTATSEVTESSLEEIMARAAAARKPLNDAIDAINEGRRSNDTGALGDTGGEA